MPNHLPLTLFGHSYGKGKLILFFLLLLCFNDCYLLNAQSFVPENLPVADQINGTINLIDADSDGDLDLLANQTYYRNEDGVFVKTGDGGGVMQLGDFNNDGLLDGLGEKNIGKSNTLIGVVAVFPFDGCNFNSNRIGDVFKKRLWSEGGSGGCAFGDNDGDGDTDILYSGSFPERETKIFHKENFSYHHTASIPTINAISKAFWEDYDRDGDLDLLLKSEVVEIFEHHGESYLPKPIPTTSLTTLKDVLWVDLNQDGYLDVVRLGGGPLTYSPTGIEVLLNQQGKYQQSYSHTLTIFEKDGISTTPTYQSCHTGDMDNDGDVDVVVKFYALGDGSTYEYIRIYANQGDGTFIPSIDLQLENLTTIPLVIDCDRDGDMDIVCGNIVYKNNLSLLNNPPSIPTNLTTQINGRQVSFQWKEATDDHTAQSGLTYNIHIFQQLPGLHFLHGLSNLANGYRQITKAGNAGFLNRKDLQHLPDGKYFWTLQAIDVNSHASSFAPIQSFTIGLEQTSFPTIQIKNFNKQNDCSCPQYWIDVEPVGTFHAGNRFTLQISDSTGSFAVPTTLFPVMDYTVGDSSSQNLFSTSTNKIAPAMLTKSMPAGTRYRVRVVSTNPAVASPDIGYDFSIYSSPSIPKIAAVPNTFLCINPKDTHLQLESLASNASSYIWELSPTEAGSIKAQVNGALVNWSDTFIGKVKITVKGINNVCGKGSASLPIEMTIGSPLSMPGLIQGPSLLCPGQRSVIFQVSPLIDIDKYNWLLPAGISFSNQSPTDSHIVLLDIDDAFISGQLSVAAQNPCGISSYSSSFVKTTQKVALAPPISGPDIMCPGTVSATFSIGVIEGANQYIWNLPPGCQPFGKITTTNSNITVKFDKQDFSGEVTVYGINSCSQGELSPPFVIKVVSSLPIPKMPQGQQKVCIGIPSTYTVPFIEGAYQYLWTLPTHIKQVGNSTLTSSNSITLLFEEGFQQGILQVMIKNECEVSTASPGLNLEVEPAPGNIKLVQECNFLKANLDLYPLQWYLNGDFLPGHTQSSIQVQQKGLYSVEIYTPCDTLISESIEIAPIVISKEKIPNVFTPNGDNSNETFTLPSEMQGVEIEVYNRWGKLIYQSSSYQNDWNGEQEASGIYFYLVKNQCLANPLRGMIHILR